jgi:hypothetical protein
MATTKPDVQYVQIERVQFWADKENGDIHITTDDPDAKEIFKHTTISNRETSKRYHPTFYRQLATLLTQHGKTVPGWDLLCQRCGGEIVPMATSTTGYRHKPGLPECDTKPPEPQRAG